MEYLLQKLLQFYPCVFIAHVPLVMEANGNLKMIASQLTAKYQQPYSREREYVKSRVAKNLRK